MASEIKDKFGSPTAFTITLASLASSTTGVGRQSTMVDNSTTRYSHIKIVAKIKMGTAPAANKAVYLYFLRDDGAGIASDGAGASDAAITIKNAPPLGTLEDGTAPATGDVLIDSFEVYSPGPKFGVAVVQDTGVALDATGGSFVVEYIGINPEAQ